MGSSQSRQDHDGNLRGQHRFSKRQFFSLTLIVCSLGLYVPVHLVMAAVDHPVHFYNSWVGGKNITSTPLIQKDLRIAARYWGVSPAEVAAKNGCQNYRVFVGSVSGLIGDSVLGASSKGMVAMADRHGCEQRILPHFWKHIQDSTSRLREGCAVVVHEFGHSIGKGHSPDPNSVMSASPEGDSVAGCRAAFPYRSE